MRVFCVLGSIMTLVAAAHDASLVFGFFAPWVLIVLSAMVTILLVVAILACCRDLRTRRIKYLELPDEDYAAPYTLKKATTIAGTNDGVIIAEEITEDQQVVADRRRQLKRDKFRQAVCDAYAVHGVPLPKSYQERAERTAQALEEKAVSPVKDAERESLLGSKKAVDKHPEEEN